MPECQHEWVQVVEDKAIGLKHIEVCRLCGVKKSEKQT